MTNSEKSFKAVMEEAGFIAIKNGWPDFLCMNPEKTELFAVEVKTGDDEPTEDQRRMHRLLAMHGVKVYIVRVPSRTGPTVYVPLDMAEQTGMTIPGLAVPRRRKAA